MLNLDGIYTEIETRYEDVNGVERQTMVCVTSDTIRTKLHVGNVRGNPDEICRLLAEIQGVILAHAEVMADKKFVDCRK